MPPTKAIIFDLDGTLIDSEKLHLKAELETFKSFGMQVKKEQLLGYMGMGLTDYFKLLKKKLNASYSVKKIEKAHSKTLEKYYGARNERSFSDEKHLDNMVTGIAKASRDWHPSADGKLFPEVPNTKQAIKELSKKYILALGTSSHTHLAKICLKRLGIIKYFKVIVGGDKTKHAKPHPEIFLLIARKLKTSPAQITVIEDSTNGFKAAKSAGMKVIARVGQHNKAEDFSLADHKIKNLLEIKTYLNEN